MVACSASPSCDFASERGEVTDSAATEAFARDQACLDLRDIEPASVLGRVVDGETTPEPAAFLRAEGRDQRFLAMGV